MDEWSPSAATLHAASGAPGLFYGATRSRNSRARALRCDAFLARESAGPLREPSLSLPIPTELYVTLQEVDAPTEPRASHKKQTIYIYIYT